MGTVDPLTVAVKTTTSPTTARSGSAVRLTLSGGRGLTRLGSTHLSHAESDQCLSWAGGGSPLSRRLGHSCSSSQLGGRPPTAAPLAWPPHQTGSQQSIESRLAPASRSEDELSAGSLSPGLRRRLRADASTPSSGSGRSQASSPRVPAGRRASYGGYLQADLRRLLADVNLDRGPRPGAAADGGSGLEAAETDVLLTTARPAQVVEPEPGVPLPAGQVDWQSLVDTATRAELTHRPDSR